MKIQYVCEKNIMKIYNARLLYAFISVKGGVTLLVQSNVMCTM